MDRAAGAGADHHRRLLADVRLPGNFPVGLAALLVGTAIGWIGGYMGARRRSAAGEDIAHRPARRSSSTCCSTGLGDIAPLLATAIPLGIYNFTEAMTNVESAAAAGDNYNLRSVLLADGTGAIVGSALGSPFPPAVYVGHPGWKAAGGRIGYSLATGVVDRAAVLLRAVRAARRAAADAGDRADPALHRPADRRAGVPGGRRRRTRGGRAGDHPEHRGVGDRPDRQRARGGRHHRRRGRRRRRWPTPGVVYDGLRVLGRGAVLAGLVLGAIVAFIIDKRFVARPRSRRRRRGAAFVGLIHAREVEWNADGQVALGYLFAGGLRAYWVVCVPRTRACGRTIRWRRTWPRL